MSEIRTSTVSDLAGTGPVTLTKQSAAKAWVNFNGTGTIAARDSFNVASLTDNGTALYTVNFSSAMGNADFAAVAISTESSTRVSDGTAPTTTTVRINPSADSPYVSATICGDLA